MKFSIITSLAMAALTTAGPIHRRAVFSTTAYNDLAISGGVAGNAKQEALNVLSGLPSDLSTVEKADLDFLNSVNQIANQVEKEGYNTAIEAATGEEAEALQRGKTKNKVLKLTATMLKLQAQAAQGQDVAAKMEEEQKKLNNNIAADEAAAGQQSTFVPFDVSTS